MLLLRSLKHIRAISFLACLFVASGDMAQCGTVVYFAGASIKLVPMPDDRSRWILLLVLVLASLHSLLGIMLAVLTKRWRVEKRTSAIVGLLCSGLFVLMSLLNIVMQLVRNLPSWQGWGQIILFGIPTIFPLLFFSLAVLRKLEDQSLGAAT